MSVEYSCDRCGIELPDTYSPEKRLIMTSFHNFDNDFCDVCKNIIKDLCDNKYPDMKYKLDTEFEKSLWDKGDRK